VVKRNPFILTLGFILVLSAVTIFYIRYNSKESVSIWDIIPGEAVLVFEAGECNDCLVQIQGTSFWEIFHQSLAHNIAKDSLDEVFKQVLDSRHGGFVSLHLTQKDDFDFVFYLPQKSFEQWSKELDKWNARGIKFNQREFNGVQINEISINGRLFSWTSFEELWIASYTPVLVEDVIRTYKSNGNASLRNKIGEVHQLPRIKNDAGNVYVNLRGISSFLSVFLEKNIALPNLGHSALLDVKHGKNAITLNGFTLAGSNAQSALLSLFSTQSPVPFSIKQYISNRSIVVTNYGLSDGTKLLKSLDISKNLSLRDSLQSLANVDLDALFSGLGKEIALCMFESRGSTLSRILLFETSNPEEWLRTFDALSKATEKEDTLYYEKYSTYEIREIEIRHLPEKLFKPLIHGFEQTYYSHIGQTLIVADRVEELRRLLDDIDKEEVLGKSVMFNQFLESTLLEANLSIYINTPRALGLLVSGLNPKWKNVYSTLSKNSLSTLGFSAYQFSHLNESFYTNLTWSFSSNDKSSVQQQSTVNRIQTNIDRTIVSKPFIVRNYLTRKDEFLVQDSLLNIHYFSADGKHQWRKDVGGEIIGEVYQLDYLANNKLQLLLATDNKLHVIDRLGNNVPPFPVAHEQKNVEFVSLLDYDNSKRYRYLLADKFGKIWLLDKEGKSLNGWKPKNVEGPLFAKPDHYRIRGKDFILAIRKDGWVYLMNRRGEPVKGYPLNLEIRPEGSYFLETGNTLATSHFVVVSRDGIIVKFNIEGQIVSREALVKSAVDDHFSLIVEKGQKAYLIKRQNSRQVTLLDENGKPFLTNDFVGSASIDIQYYDFGAGKTYVLLVDSSQELCYVYDGLGNLLTPVPLEASSASLRQDGNSIFAATVSGSSLSVQLISN
jgi:hypothetical protein